MDLGTRDSNPSACFVQHQNLAICNVERDVQHHLVSADIFHQKSMGVSDMADRLCAVAIVEDENGKEEKLYISACDHECVVEDIFMEEGGERIVIDVSKLPPGTVRIIAETCV